MKKLKFGPAYALAMSVVAIVTSSTALASTPVISRGKSSIEINMTSSPDRKYGQSAVVANPVKPTTAGRSDGIIEIDVTKSPDYRNGQPEIAINPRNANNQVFTSTRFSQGNPVPPGPCFVAYSRDRGKTWAQATWPLGDRPQCGESQVEVDAKGTFYVYSNELGCPPGEADQAQCILVLNRTVVSRSTDGGRTWSKPVQTPLQIGGSPKFRVDAETGKLYALGGFNAALFPSGLSVSADQGKTWRKPVSVPGPSECVPLIPGMPPRCGFPGTQIAVHDGVAAVARQSQADGVIFSVSRDDGKNFKSLPVTDSDGTPVAGLPPGDIGGGADPIPWISADPTRKDRFAVMMPGDGTFEVYVTNNAGRTWKGPATIDAPNAFNPWIEFGSHEGLLGVMWRARTNPPGGVDAYSVVSFNDGRSFSSPLKVNEATQPIDAAGPPGDDWSGIVLDGKFAYVTWPDGRGGGLIDGIFARVPLSLFGKRR